MVFISLRSRIGTETSVETMVSADNTSKTVCAGPNKAHSSSFEEELFRGFSSKVKMVEF